MVSNEDKLHLELTKITMEAIIAYCRVLEVHTNAVAQGANPVSKGLLGDAVKMASLGLKREVEFLDFLRSGVTDVVSAKVCLGE